jgi:hypothetical protein
MNKSSHDSKGKNTFIVMICGEAVNQSYVRLG